MPILKTIQTTSAQILTPDGADGFGWVQIRPNAPFEYFDGVSTISVSDAPKRVAVRNGKLQATLELQPNTGAVNNPETFYIVDINVNGTDRRIFWQIDSADPSAIEFAEVRQLAGGSTETPIAAHEQAVNPHRQYLTRSDTVDASTTGNASDGRGYVPRLDPTTGQLPKDMYTGGAGGIEADDVPITDAGGYYTGTEVEAALQEVGPTIEYVTEDFNRLAYHRASVSYAIAVNVGAGLTYSTLNSITLPGSSIGVSSGYAFLFDCNIRMIDPVTGQTIDVRLYDATGAVEIQKMTLPPAIVPVGPPGSINLRVIVPISGNEAHSFSLQVRSSGAGVTTYYSYMTSSIIKV